jgi:hypothetical protein
LNLSYLLRVDAEFSDDILKHCFHRDAATHITNLEPGQKRNSPYF